MMQKSESKDLINEIFRAWHLRHIDPDDHASIANATEKIPGIYFGTREIQEDLRPFIQSQFLQLADARLPFERLEIKRALVNACEPPKLPEPDEQAALQEMEERFKRAEIVAQLMLACAPFLDISDHGERRLVAEALGEIHRSKSRLTSQGRTAVLEILSDFLEINVSAAKSEGQIIAITVLAAEAPTRETADLLSKIVRNRGHRYNPLVVQQAALCLARVLGAKPGMEGISGYCDALCDFIRSSTNSDTLDIIPFIDSSLGELLPSIGKPMLDQLIQHAIQKGGVSGDRLRQERWAFNSAINQFGDDALAPVLIALNQNLESRPISRPLVMILKRLSENRAHYWVKPISLSEGSNSITMLDILTSIVENNLPADDLAVEALGQAIHRTEIRELFWSKAEDQSTHPKTRATCLWSLFRVGRETGHKMSSTCEKWLSSDRLNLEIAAIVIKMYMNRNYHNTRVIELFAAESYEIIQWCHAAPEPLIPILRSMLHEPGQRHAAIRILERLGKRGWDQLADEYMSSVDAQSRLPILEALLRLPTYQLRQYDLVLDQAFRNTMEERLMAERKARRMAPAPASSS